MNTAIQAYFNARRAEDTQPRSMYVGIDGDVSDNIITNIPDFLRAAKRDYGILRVPALVDDPFGGVDENGNVCPAIREVNNQFHLARNSDGCVVSPHTVTGSYAPMTLMDVAEEVNPWCEAGWCVPDAVYSGKNESLEILTLRLEDIMPLSNGEQWSHHIVFRLPHGAGGKVRGTIMSFREVCSNTFGSMSSGVEFVITHRISAKMTEEERRGIMTERARQAAAALETTKRYIRSFGERVQEWISTPLSYAQTEKLTDTLLDIQDVEKAKPRRKNVREAILNAFSMPQFGTHGQNLYDWLNAVTFVNSSPNAEIVTRSKVSATDRMIRNIDPNGSGYKFEAKAEKIAAAFMADRS